MANNVKRKRTKATTPFTCRIKETESQLHHQQGEVNSGTTKKNREKKEKENPFEVTQSHQDSQQTN